MMKPNPKNYEAFIDPNGGEWIRVKNGLFKDVIWRPADIAFSDDNQITFQAEFLNGVVTDPMFETISGSIIRDIIEKALSDNE